MSFSKWDIQGTLEITTAANSFVTYIFQINVVNWSFQAIISSMGND